MFTGIIEEVGSLRSLHLGSSTAVLEIEAQKVLAGTRVGDSIATSGVCLTVTRLTADRFWADAMPETVRRTTLAGLRAGAQLNLERALAMGSRIGGHLVAGHVDGSGTVLSVAREGNATVVSLRASQAVTALSVPQGSIAVDGVSLTIADVSSDRIVVSLIPHTAAVTTLSGLRPGTAVNLETDLIGKYVQPFLSRRSTGESLTWEKLAEAGFA